MKLIPTTPEEFKQVSTPEGMRKRIRQCMESNPHIKHATMAADIGKLSAYDRMTIMAFHALMQLEAAEQALSITASRKG